MKNILTLFLLLSTFPLFAQEQDDDEIKPWKNTGWQFGVMPAMELSNGILNNSNSSPLTFAPDITISYKSNTIGFGPRIDGVGQRTVGPNNQEFGLGLNYLKYFRSTHKSFDFFAYYNFEYFHNKSTYPAYWYSYSYTTQFSYYNFTAGVGWHLNFSRHLYLSQILALGISVQNFKSNPPVPMFVDYRYDNNRQTSSSVFKVAIGYNF